MKYILILLGLAAFRSFGQEDMSRFQLGVNFSPDVNYRILENNDGTEMSDAIINSRDDREIPKFGYSTGLNVCFNINRFLGIETGLQYSNKGYQTEKIDLIFGQPDPSLPEHLKYIDDFHYVDIPLKVNFTAGKKKVRFFSSVGITTNIFIKGTTTSVIYYSDRTERDKDPTSYDFEKVNLSPTVSAGIDYKINDRMNLRVEPTFRYGVLKIIDAPVTGYLYNGGLNVSYYFGL